MVLKSKNNNFYFLASKLNLITLVTCHIKKGQHSAIWN